eukprot:516576_1
MTTSVLVYGYLRKISQNNCISAEIILHIQLFLNEDYAANKCNKVLFINDDRILLHRGPKSHQERPERIISMTSSLLKSNLLSQCIYIQNVSPCTKNDLLTTHTDSYVDKLYCLSLQFDNNNKQDYKYSKDFDNVYYNTYSLLSCQVSVGSCITMVKHLLCNYNDINYGITLVRPPGHHCNSDTPLDFCLVNNVAITANYIYNNYNTKYKICIIDIDIHHGNGTQDIFYKNGYEKNVLFISIHYKNDGKGHYRNTGEHGMNINIPFPCVANVGNYEYYIVFTNIILPILNQFKPDIILISMGFDACINDLIGKFKLSPKFYGLLMWLLINKYSNKCKIGLVLEGGYNIQMLPKCIKNVLKALLRCNDEHSKFNNNILNMIKNLKPTNKKVYQQTVTRINECIECFSKYWEFSHINNQK